MGLFEFTENVTLGLIQGNLLFSNQDIRVPGPLPIRFNRLYSSTVEKTGPFGRGWSHEYNRSLEIHDENIIYFNEFLQETQFIRNPEGKWYSVTQKRAELESVPNGYTLVLIPGQTYRFNLSGQLVSLEYRDGNFLKFEYLNGRLSRIVNPASRAVSLSYNAQGSIKYAVITAGTETRSLVYKYDLYGQLISVTDPMGFIYTYEYDDFNLKKIADPEGRSLYFLFDTQDRVVKAWTGDSPNLKTILYNPDKKVTTLIDGAGSRTEFYYNESGLIEKERYADGSACVFRWDAYGQITQVTLADGRNSYFSYDPTGNLVSESAPDGNYNNYRYNEHHQVEQWVNAHGYTTNYFYDQQGNLVQVVEPGQRISRFNYDQRGLILESVNPGGFKRQYLYDGDGNIAQLTDEKGSITKFEYDVWGWLKTITDPKGGKITKTLDKNNREINTVRPDGTVLQTVWDKAGRVLKIVNATSMITLFSYDTPGRVLSVTNPAGMAIQYRYDTAGNIKKIIYPNATETCIEYDVMGRAVRKIHPDGGIERNRYDTGGRMVEKIDSEDQLTRFEYNAGDRVIRVTDETGYKRSYEYDRLGHLVQEVDESGQKTTYRFTVEGWLSEIFFPDGGSISRTFDKMGNMISELDPENRKTEYTYDELNRLISVKDAAGHVRYYEYDAHGNLTSQANENGHTWKSTYDIMGRKTADIDPTGGIKKYEYDKFGNLTMETDPTGHITRRAYSLDRKVTDLARIYQKPGGETVEYREKYEYTSPGVLTAVTDPNGGVTRFEYDKAGNLVKMTDPLGREETYTYNRLGGLISKKDFNGNIVQYGYDPKGRLVSTSLPGDRKEEYRYTPAGLIASVKSPDYEALHTYDSMRRLTGKKITAPYAAELFYQYDKCGNCLSVKDDKGALVEYRYDALDRMTQLKDTDCGTWEFGYTPAGLRERVVYPNGITMRWWYDEAERIAKITAAKDTQVIDQFDYSYDNASRLVGEESLDISRAYTYDTLGRLAAAVLKNKNSGTTDSISYQYDNNSNRTGRKENDGSLLYTFDSASRILKGGDTQYTPDANGCRISKTEPGGQTSYSYDAQHRLTGVAFPTGSAVKKVSFGYIPEGGRVWKRIEKQDKTENIHYLHDGNHVLREFADGQPANRYIHGPGIDDLLGIHTPTGPLFAVTDIRKSIAAVTDNQGAVKQRLSYSPFGRISQPISPPLLPYSFTGREYDPETSLYYYRARYYDPRTACFLTPDPPGFKDGLNRYFYCTQDPINHMDPSGNFAIAIPGLLFLAGLGIDYLMAYCRSRSDSLKDYYLSGEYSVFRGIISGTASALSGGMGSWLSNLGWNFGRVFIASLLTDTAISTIQSGLINQIEGEGFDWKENFWQNLLFNGVFHGIGSKYFQQGWRDFWRSGRSGQTGLGRQLLRFFTEDRRTFGMARDFFRRYRPIFGTGHGWSMHHWFFQQRWYRGANPIFAPGTTANRILQSLGDAGWNSIPLPQSINSALYRIPGATPAFAAGTIYGTYQTATWSWNSVTKAWESIASPGQPNENPPGTGVSPTPEK